MLLVALAVPPLVRQPLWYDEVASRDASARSLAGIWHLLHHTDAVFGPYYLLVHLLLEVGGAAWWLRLPSLLASIGTVVLVGILGCRLLGATGGFVAALVYAVNPFVVSYAHDARPYALATLGVTAAWLVLIDGVGRRRTGIVWAVIAAASIAAHLFALLSLLPQLFLLVRESWPWRRWALLPLAIALVLAGVSLGQRGQVGWIPRPPWFAVLGGGATLAGGWWMLPLCALGLIAAVRRPGADRRLTLVAAWAFGPLVLLVAGSEIIPLYLPRYLIEAAVPLALLTAKGALVLPRLVSRVSGSLDRGVGAGVAAMLLASIGVSALQSAKPYRYEDLPAAADFVRDSSHPRDGLVYLGDTVRLALVDAVSAQVGGAGTDDGPVPVDVLLDKRSDATVAGLLEPGSISAAQVPVALRSPARLWVASWVGPGTLPDADPTVRAARAALARSWAPVAQQSFGSLQIALWQRR